MVIKFDWMKMVRLLFFSSVEVTLNLLNRCARIEHQVAGIDVFPITGKWVNRWVKCMAKVHTCFSATLTCSTMIREIAVDLYL